MKSIMKQKLKNLWSDESAQGATEYILLLVVVVAIVVLFKEKIKTLIDERMGVLGDSIKSVTPN